MRTIPVRTRGLENVDLEVSVSIKGLLDGSHEKDCGFFTIFRICAGQPSSIPGPAGIGVRSLWENTGRVKTPQDEPGNRFADGEKTEPVFAPPHPQVISSIFI